MMLLEQPAQSIIVLETVRTFGKMIFTTYKNRISNKTFNHHHKCLTYKSVELTYTLRAVPGSTHHAVSFAQQSPPSEA